MNESAIDSLQNGIAAVFANHFFKGQHTIFTRVCVLIVNVPLMIIALQGGARGEGGKGERGPGGGGGGGVCGRRREFPLRLQVLVGGHMPACLPAAAA